MNKWQKIDELYTNHDRLSESDMWTIVDSIRLDDVVEMARFWLYRSRVPGDIFGQAQSILDWHFRLGILTDKQRRWLVMAMVAYWDCLNLNARSYLQAVL